MNKFFLYLDYDTWLHRLDARTKVLSLLGLFVIALAFSDPRYVIIPTVLLMALIGSARAMRNVRKIWILLTLLLLYCLLLWPFFVTGRTPFLTIGEHVVTWEAASFGLAMGLRLNLMLLGGILLLSTTTIEDFTLALRRLGLPSSVSFALSLAFRWVPSLIESAGSIVQAQRARGLDLGTGHVLARLRRYPPLLVPLIGHQLRQTRLLAMALESKGFGPGARRVSLRASSMRVLDWVTLSLVLAAAGVSLWLRLNGYGTVDVQL